MTLSWMSYLLVPVRRYAWVKNGDVDLILVHAPASEMKFLEDGSGVERKSIMHNDFVIVGPDADPANLKSAKSF